MSTKVIVDTSIWIDFFKGRNEHTRAELRSLIKTKRAVLVGMVLTEILQGIRSTQEREKIYWYLNPLLYIETNRETWIEVSNFSRKLRSDGITIPMSDIIIAALAKQHDLEIFTHDPHFNYIPTLKLYKY